HVTGVQTCALPIWPANRPRELDHLEAVASFGCQLPQWRCPQTWLGAPQHFLRVNLWHLGNISRHHATSHELFAQSSKLERERTGGRGCPATPQRKKPGWWVDFLLLIVLTTL